MTSIIINLTDLPEDCFRDDIDDALRGVVKGQGRVSGGGIALDGRGVNFDLELSSSNKGDVRRFLDILLNYLRSLPAPAGSSIVVAGDDGEFQVSI
jgi:hypothetical protein